METIFQDPEFRKDFKKTIVVKYDLSGELTRMRKEIRELAAYSPYDKKIHKEFERSNCINDIAEYHKYLVTMKKNDMNRKRK